MKSAQERKEATSRWAKKNRAHINKKRREWRLLNLEKCRKKDSDRYYSIKSNDPHRSRSRYWKSQKMKNETGKEFGHEDYSKLLAKQNNKCAICFGDAGKRGWQVDHDHKTGFVRGILCGKCNTALGLLNDKKELCLNAATYLSN